MTLSEKNSLYIEQKKEINRLKNIIVELEDQLLSYHQKDKRINRYELVHNFLEDNCIKFQHGKVEAKILFEAFENWLVLNNSKWSIKNRLFYKILALNGFLLKNGSKNKLYVYGLEWDYASKTNN